MFAYDKNIVPYINQELDQNIKLDKGIYIAEVTKNFASRKSRSKEGRHIARDRRYRARKNVWT